MIRTAAQLALVTAVAFCLASCETLILRDTWHSPVITGKRYQKLLVASLVKSSEERQVYEEIITAELSRAGIKTVASHTLLPGKVRPNRKTLMEAMKRADADGLLTIQTVRVERMTDVQPGYSSYYPNYGYGYGYSGFSPSWGYYGNYGNYGNYGGYSGYYEPPSVISYDLVTMQANLFDSGSGRLVWAATMETIEPGRIVSLGKDLARIISRSLASEGLI